MLRRARNAIACAAVAAIAAICAWRIFAFRPEPLDSPGTLRPLLHAWFHSYTRMFARPEDAWFIWHLACYFAIFAFPSLALLNYFWRRKAIRFTRRADRLLCSQPVFWLSYAACLVLCRYPVLLLNELNPDEGQFLASAFKLFYDPNFFHAADCHTSGPGNVYPLMWPAIFGLSPDFVSGRILALVTILCSMYLLYRTVRLVAPDELARIAVLPVAAFFPVFSTSELVYNSSEQIPVLLIALAAFLAVRVFVRPQENSLRLFLLGLIASTAFLTKLQSVPIVAAAGIAALAFVAVKNGRRAAARATLVLAGGASLPLLVTAIACLRAGVLNDFWQSYILANIDYVDSNAGVLFEIRWFLGFVIQPPELRLFFFAAAVISLVWLIQKAARTRVSPGAETSVNRDAVRWLGWLALLCTAAAFYSAYKAHRAFVHYLLFLFFPVGLLLAWMLVQQVRRTALLPVVAAVAALASTAWLWSFRDSRIFAIPNMIRVPEGDLIRTVTEPGSRIYVWGWTALPYLASARVPATRQTLVGTLFRSYNVMTDPPEYHPTATSERVSAYYRNRELRDLTASPPALFIDAIGPASWFLSSREYFGFDRVPEIAAFVHANYIHLVDLYNERFYLRRDLAARREAMLAWPLPTKTCAPNTLSCLDSPVTIPRELPPVNIPGRARIELEFMPSGTEIGTATVFNTEAQPNSFRGLRLQHVHDNRYILLAGLGNRWAVSKEIPLPEGKPAFVTIELDDHRVTIGNNGSVLDTLAIERPVANAGGPIDLGSWIWGMDPFSGKIQFFEVSPL